VVCFPLRYAISPQTVNHLISEVALSHAVLSEKLSRANLRDSVLRCVSKCAANVLIHVVEYETKLARGEFASFCDVFEFTTFSRADLSHAILQCVVMRHILSLLMM